MIEPLPVTDQNSLAVAYVSTTPAEGLAQLEILKQLGCRPEHRVLEVGCGALIAGYPIMQYLELGGYVGIDPNAWLIGASLDIFDVALVTDEKHPCLLHGSDFRANPGTMFFDYVLSHSILSHASSAQFDDFLLAMTEQLAPGGIVAASLRLAEGNAFGSAGSHVHGVAFTSWQYPGVSWFRRDDVFARAKRAGLKARIEPSFTALIKAAHQHAVHDWLILERA